MQFDLLTNLGDSTLTLVSDPMGIVRERLPKLRDPLTTGRNCGLSFGGIMVEPPLQIIARCAAVSYRGRDSVKNRTALSQKIPSVSDSL